MNEDKKIKTDTVTYGNEMDSHGYKCTHRERPILGDPSIQKYPC